MFTGGLERGYNARHRQKLPCKQDGMSSGTYFSHHPPPPPNHLEKSKNMSQEKIKEGI